MQFFLGTIDPTDPNYKKAELACFIFKVLFLK